MNWVIICLVLLLFTPLFIPLARALAYAVLAPILVLIRYWPFTLIALFALWWIYDDHLASQATLEHPYVVPATGRFHYPGQTWIDYRGLRHTVTSEGMEEITPAS